MTRKLFLLVFTIFHTSAQVTFKNVTLWSSPEDKIGFISSGNHLKDHLPQNFINVVAIQGQIPILFEDSVKNIDNVKEIYFYNNEILEIRPGAFKNLYSVKHLRIQKSNLTNIGNVFDDLTVESLEVSQNPIAKIETGSLKNMPNLKYLILEKNKIELIEDRAFENLKNVNRLDLSNNLITNLPPGVFKNLPELKMLTLRSNKINQIDATIFSSGSIQYLDLSDNSISAIPKNFMANMPNLQRILLIKNSLESIPEGVFSNTTLHQVELTFNKISFIAPSAFDNMPNLANIMLTSNKLQRYDPRWFHNTKNIFRLFLTNNLIEELPDQAFKNIYNDKEQWIKLDSNKIKVITTETFKGLRKFSTLHLAHNEIEKWSADYLQDSEVVYYLNLIGNKIRCPEGNFDEVFKANFTYLAGNPLEAECLKKIEEWSLKNPTKVVCPGDCGRY